MKTGIPRFEPHPMLRNGHMQTIGGRYLPGRVARVPSREVDVALEDGDRLRLIEAIPEGWRPGDGAAVLVHGLAGAADSPYMVRVAARLSRQGIRAVRLNLRGAGAGFGLARSTYHAGRTEDLGAVVKWLAGEAPGSPIALIGFSLGGNLVLKLAAEAAEVPLAGLDCVLAANPPLDIAACCRNMLRPSRRIYDRNFVQLLRRDVLRLHAAFPELGPVDLSKVRTVFDFDESYTAPRNGFSGAADYYGRSSAGPLLPKIRIPGLVVHARDDPFIPVESYEDLKFPSSLALELITSGGHLGYISRTRWGGDRRWLDSRLAFWLDERWGEASRNRQGGHHAHDHHEH